MKITKRKHKGERYTLIFETKQEAVQFAHYVGCRNNPQNCNLEEIRNGKFHSELRALEQKLPSF